MKIGLTGNIASGKSEVEKIIKKCGFDVYDLDVVVHKLYENSDVQSELIKHFDTTNRKIISDIVFSSPQKMKILEEIIHPKLRNFITSVSNKDLIFISGALIYEANFDTYFDKIIYITAPKDIRIKRLIKRNNYSVKDAEKRINFQTSDFEKKADFVISNDSSMEDLEFKVQEVLSKLQ